MPKQLTQDCMHVFLMFLYYKLINPRTSEQEKCWSQPLKPTVNRLSENHEGK